MTAALSHRFAAEAVGTSLLLATVVGSGIMGEALAGGNTAIALLGNTIPTGAILVVLISVFGPVSGAHFNPAVSLVFFLRKELSRHDFLLYTLAQIVGGLFGVFAAHMMFDLDILQFSQKIRTGPSQWFSELIATFGLVLTILACLKHRAEFVPMAVGLYITAAYWFTASTSFANPAVTIARSFSNTFAGIHPEHMPMFILSQVIGAVIALYYYQWQFADK